MLCLKGRGDVVECMTKVSQKRLLVINASLVHYTDAVSGVFVCMFLNPTHTIGRIVLGGSRRMNSAHTLHQVCHLRAAVGYTNLSGVKTVDNWIQDLLITLHHHHPPTHDTYGYRRVGQSTRVFICLSSQMYRDMVIANGTIQHPSYYDPPYMKDLRLFCIIMIFDNDVILYSEHDNAYNIYL